MTQGGLILSAGCVRSKKTERKQNTKSRRTQSTPRNPQQPGDRDHLETACDVTRLMLSPYSPTYIDPGFVQIGLVQLSHSVKTTNVTYTVNRRTDGQAD